MKKWRVVGLVGGMAFVTDLIRIAMGIVAPTLMELHDISLETMGVILSGWNWAYTGSLLFIGPIIDRFGPWLVVGIGAGFWGTATLALPLVSTAPMFFVMRALFGLGHSMRIPSQAACISRWMGPDQRATAVGLCFFGGQVGFAIGPALAAGLMSGLGWEWVFYAFGGLSILFSLIWFSLYPREEGQAEAPSPEEQPGDEVKIPWSALLGYRATWGIALGQMGYLYAYFFFMSWFPGYLILELDMTVQEAGILTGLLFGMGMIGVVVGGWLGDLLIRRGASRTASRKGMIVTGLTGATILIVAAAFVTQIWLVVTLLTLCMGSLRMTTASANSVPIDLAPPGAVASLASLQNFSGNIGGLLAPMITGFIVGATGGVFFFALLMAGGMALMGACSYLFIVGPLETLPVTRT